MTDTKDKAPAGVDQALLEKVWEQVSEIDTSLEKLNDDLVIEEAKLAAAYEQKKQPLYAERQKLCSQIPMFWATVLENHPYLGPLITMEEMDLLGALDAIDIEREPEEPAKFKIYLRFNDNDYLADNTIVKQFGFEEATGEILCASTKIQWKDDKKNLTNPPEGEDTCFFKWFAADDADVGSIIASDIFPNAIHYYQADVDDEDDEGEEELLSEEDEDEDDDEDDAPKKKKAKADS
ncbi:hypothetical protein H4R34_002785 [Dimargaris verticillata]|uniref:Nucleosome assembly protein n=1 Tax=Dimargaris verticillata TaxID=2761393 RepID=A0A9W8EDS3_9FUNG|nr:hypothetical protein H4R34_002785 [Dimargaris verticillata]